MIAKQDAFAFVFYRDDISILYLVSFRLIVEKLQTFSKSVRSENHRFSWTEVFIPKQLLRRGECLG